MFFTEEKLMEKLKQKFRSRFFFEEVGGGYGIADLIVVRDKAEFNQFLKNRNGVHLKNNEQIKIFIFIRNKRNGVAFEEILANHYIPSEQLKYKVLKYLLDIEAITFSKGKYFRNNSFYLFSPNIDAFEGKLNNWKAGFSQAIRYQKFAKRSYLALDKDYIHRVDINEFKRNNIGLISVGSKVTVVYSPEFQKPLDPVMRYRIAENIIQNSNKSNI